MHNTLRVLVAIANYGTGNRTYLDRLIDEYQGMPWHTDIVVLSNIPKTLKPGVEVMVGLPTKNPWSLPFGHRELFERKQDDYDLFIYSEDDTLVTARNIQAFLAASEVLPEDCLPGFLRTETAPDGAVSFPEVHGWFRWHPQFTRVCGGQVFAYFDNEHAALYLLTRKQLKRAISSEGFVVPPHEERYDLLVTAATDPYTQCGFRKLVGISNLEDFLVPHLPNKYIGRIGAASEVVHQQIRVLMDMARSSSPGWTLTSTESKLPRARWSKEAYEPADDDVARLVPPSAKSVLSIGCGFGAMEAALKASGHDVVGMPLDSVIAACAAARGIELVCGPFEKAMAELGGRQFDAVLCTNLLQVMPDPVGVIRKAHALLRPGGTLVVSVPNMSRPRVLSSYFRRHVGYRDLGSFERTGVNWTSVRTVGRWLKRGGFVQGGVIKKFDKRAAQLNERTKGLAARWLASELIVSATRAS